MKNTMKKVSVIALALVLVAAGLAASLAGAESVTVTENTTIVTSPFTAAVQKVHGSVVGVSKYTLYQNRNNYNRNGSYGWSFGFGYGYGYGDSNEDTAREVLSGTGSGVVVAKGYVLTNYHVVESASKLEVTTETETYSAKLMGKDEAKDLAVLYVEGLDLEPVVLGDSDNLIIGDWAICIGNPLSFVGTTTVGIISGVNREINGESTDAYGKRVTNTMIQTDAAINAGNSGGGMFNVAGELIGIPSMKYSSSSSSTASVEGIGMAIPINVAKPLIQSVLEGNGNVESNDSDSAVSKVRPRIGVTISNMNSSSSAVANGLLPIGAYVNAVEEGGPAEKAGIAVGDIVVEIDGERINSTTEMINYMGTKNAGDKIKVKVYRVEGGLDNVTGNKIPNGDYIDLEVELAMLDEVQQ